MSTLLRRSCWSGRIGWMGILVGVGGIALSGNVLGETKLRLEADVDGDASVRILSPPDTRVRLLRSERLADRAWDVDSGLMLSWRGDITLKRGVVGGAGFGFFAAEEWPPAFTLTAARGEYVLEVGEGALLHQVLQAIHRDHGVQVFPYEPLDSSTVLPRGTYSASTLEALIDQLGIPLWAVLPNDTDPAKSDYVPNTGRRPGEIPDPDHTGEGVMEDGFGGIDGLPTPGAGPTLPPEPAPDADKPWDRDIDPAPDGVDQEGEPEPVGKHLRVAMDLDLTSGASVLWAREVPGTAIPTNWPAAPPGGALVYVVSSIGVRENEGIFHIGVRSSPFEERSYLPMGVEDESHDLREAGRGVLRVPVPYPDEATGIEELVIDVYRVIGHIPEPLLSPTVLLASLDALDLLASVDGSEVQSGLPPDPPPVIVDPPPGSVSDPILYPIVEAGPRGTRYNLVVMGDGFGSSDADVLGFYVTAYQKMIDEMMNTDIHTEIAPAFNIFFLQTFSVHSGVTTVDEDGDILVPRNTALDYRYSGIWSRCWMEGGPATAERIDALIADYIPEADGVIVMLNVDTGGGCNKGTHLAVTKGTSSATWMHEFGHNFGLLGDNYSCNTSNPCLTYTNAEPSQVNLTTVSTSPAVKWNEWIPPWRPTPTESNQVADVSQDVGIFEGATAGTTRYDKGLYRPSISGRMKNSSREFNPVGYTAMRSRALQYQQIYFTRFRPGDYTGDGVTDMAHVDHRQLTLYEGTLRDLGPDDPITGNPPRSPASVLEPTWRTMGKLENPARTRSWQFRPDDILLPGDFDGDGLDDLYVVNKSNWNQGYVGMLRSTGTGFEPVARYDDKLPGWDQIRAGDRFYVADFNGDGRDDLLVFNGDDWIMPYFLMLRSSGAGLQYMRRYDRYLPNWEMGRRERFIIGDWDGDGNDDILAYNTLDWNQVHVQWHRSTGTALQLLDRRYGAMSGWQFRAADQFRALDFDGDGDDDMAILNGANWGPTYLALLRYNPIDGSMDVLRRYDDDNNPSTTNNPLPGWELRSGDRIWAGDFDGNGADDLLIYNASNWNDEYLGLLKYTPANFGLQGSWQTHNFGAGYSQPVIDFVPGNFIDLWGMQDVFCIRWNRFLMLRSLGNQFFMQTSYLNWIKNHRYHTQGIW